jgi:hypothetical protein
VVNDWNRDEEERRAREIKERRELQQHQMEIFGCCSPDLSFPLPSWKRCESKDVFIAQNFPRVPHSRPSASGNRDELEAGNLKREPVSQPSLPKNYQCKDACIGQTLPVDMARAKLDAQDAAMKKELAYALSPTTMSKSVITKNGVEAAPTNTVAEPRSQLDYDLQPSPIPGLQNKHLNYLLYAGMPVPESQRKKFHIPQAFVSSMCARRVELGVNRALRKRNWLR